MTILGVDGEPVRGGLLHYDDRGMFLTAKEGKRLPLLVLINSLGDFLGGRPSEAFECEFVKLEGGDPALIIRPWIESGLWDVEREA